MDDLVQAVVDEVLRRQGQRPALLVGRAPQQAPGWRFVTDGPYEAVILGSLTAAELLRFPDEASAQALLEGRAGLLVDGLPLGYLAPVDLGYLMTSAEDRGHGFRVGVVPARAALCRPAARPAAAGALCRHGGLSPADAADGAAAVDFERASALCRSRPSWRCSGCWPPLSCCRRQASRCRSPWGRAFPSSAALLSARPPWRRGSSRPRPSSSWRRRASAALPYRGAAFADALRVWRMALAAAASLCRAVRPDARGHLPRCPSGGAGFVRDLLSCAVFRRRRRARPAAATPRAGTAARFAAPAARPAQSGGKAMKWTLLAAAALVLCCGLPFRTHETRTLLPVQTVQAERTEAGVRIVTGGGRGQRRNVGTTPWPRCAWLRRARSTSTRPGRSCCAAGRTAS